MPNLLFLKKQLNLSSAVGGPLWVKNKPHHEINMFLLYVNSKGVVSLHFCTASLVSTLHVLLLRLQSDQHPVYTAVQSEHAVLFP